jgi:hypothetical protein
MALRAENHGTAPVVPREAPKDSTPCNSVPYSVKLRVGLACLTLNPARSQPHKAPNAIALTDTGGSVVSNFNVCFDALQRGRPS